MTKYFSILLIYWSTSVLASAYGLIEERVLIKDLKYKKIILEHPELTVDHMSEEGFEVYGPKGMQKWLSEVGIEYQNDTEPHQHNKELGSYPSFEEIEQKLKDIVQINPSIVKMFSIGKSVEGRDLWVLKISDNVDTDEVEPEVKYISSMHGDEIVGRELTWMFAKELVENYEKDAEVTDLIDSLEIYILPSMNPDGSFYKQRANANGYDLNRNFPDWKETSDNSQDGRQIEVKHLMKFQAERNFSLSANFHGGSVVVNYPWDNTYERHPYDGLLQEISLAYSSLNDPMYRSWSFNQGITNGADWYLVSGGMQDWSYVFHNDLQVTVELSNTKWPYYSQISSFYNDNKRSLIAFLEKGHQGQGFVSDDKTDSGSVEVFNLDSSGVYTKQGSFGWEHGEFYKILPQGEYKYVIHSDKTNRSQSFSFNIIKDQSQSDYLELSL